MNQQEQAEAQAREERLAMQASALPAAPDTEADLILLEGWMREMRVDLNLKRRYEALRNRLVKQLSAEGPRYFLDEDGKKRFAYAVVPEPVDVNVAELERMYEQGEISGAVLDEVAPRKVDKSGFRRAASAGRLTKQQIARVATVRKGTGYLAYSGPLEDDD